MLLSFVLLFLIPSKKCPKCDYPIISPCFLKLPAISNALYLLSNFNILSAVFCRTLCNRAVCCCSVSVCILSAVFCRTLCNLAVCPQPIKNIVTTPSFARTCESRITSVYKKKFCSWTINPWSFVVFISSPQAIRHQAPPPGNHNKKVPGVLRSLRVSFDRFVFAFTGLILHN